MDSTTTSGLATPAEAAAFLRTPVGALAQDRYRNRGPKYIKRNNRAVLYSWEALRDYVSQNTMTGTSGRPGAA